MPSETPMTVWRKSKLFMREDMFRYTHHLLRSIKEWAPIPVGTIITILVVYSVILSLDCIIVVRKNGGRLPSYLTPVLIFNACSIKLLFLIVLILLGNFDLINDYSSEPLMIGVDTTPSNLENVFSALKYVID